MLKKGILYVVSAVLLGVALMLPPRLFLLDGYFNTKESSQFTREELAYGVTPQHPSNEISIGLMSAFSLVLAFAVFRQSKKRTV